MDFNLGIFVGRQGKQKKMAVFFRYQIILGSKEILFLLVNRLWKSKKRIKMEQEKWDVIQHSHTSDHNVAFEIVQLSTAQHRSNSMK